MKKHQLKFCGLAILMSMTFCLTACYKADQKAIFYQKVNTFQNICNTILNDSNKKTNLKNQSDNKIYNFKAVDLHSIYDVKYAKLKLSGDFYLTGNAKKDAQTFLEQDLRTLNLLNKPFVDFISLCKNNYNLFSKKLLKLSKGTYFNDISQVTFDLHWIYDNFTVYSNISHQPLSGNQVATRLFGGLGINEPLNAYRFSFNPINNSWTFSEAKNLFLQKFIGLENLK